MTTTKTKSKKVIPDKFSYFNRDRLAYVETLKAYADCHENENVSFNSSDRNLNYFLMQNPVDGKTWVDIMSLACPDGYNGFDKTVAEKVAKAFGDNAEFYLARESSVCVYVDPKGQINIDKAQKEIPSDEFHVTSLGLIRLWWD